jgi:hypothetical protein
MDYASHEGKKRADDVYRSILGVAADYWAAPGSIGRVEVPIRVASNSTQDQSGMFHVKR